jgi:hypothetical protein
MPSCLDQVSHVCMGFSHENPKYLGQHLLAAPRQQKFGLKDNQSCPSHARLENCINQFVVLASIQFFES